VASESIRCFVAFDVAEPWVVEKVSSLQREFLGIDAVLRPVDPSSLHLTLQFLGEVRSRQVRAVAEELSAVEFRPFRLVLRGVGYFPGGGRINVIWIGAEDPEGVLSSVQREVSSRLSRLGFRPDKEFTSHVTILRVKSVRDKPGLLAVIERNKDLEIGEVRLERLRLKKSVLTPSGPVYSDLHVVEAKAG